VAADGSQGNGASQGSGGNQLLVEPGAVPALRDAFADALTKVDRQIELANNDLRIAAWANDPVSADATTAFNNRAVDSGESLLAVLKSYRAQLSTAVDTLNLTAEQYRVADEDNSVTVGKLVGTGQG
jgi:hypothetical protein